MRPNSNRSLTNYLLGELLDMSAGLGALRESQRHLESRLGRVEAGMDSWTAMLQRSSPMHPASTDTTDTTLAADGLWRRLGKRALPWVAGRLLGLALPLLLPALLLAWTILKKWGGGVLAWLPF